METRAVVWNKEQKGYLRYGTKGSRANWTQDLQNARVLTPSGAALFISAFIRYSYRSEHRENFEIREINPISLKGTE